MDNRDKLEKKIKLVEGVDQGQLFGSLENNIKIVEEQTNTAISHRNGEITIKYCVPKDADDSLYDTLNDDITDKNYWLNLSGSVLEEMMKVVTAGSALDKQKINYIVELAKAGNSYTKQALDSEVVCFTVKGKPIKPKTLGQKAYVETIRRKDIVFGIGPAGTGKTYIAVAMAIQALKNKEVQRIILARPAVEAGERLGFLPGDLQDKVDPYLRPLYDALFDVLGRDATQRLKEKEAIEVVPLAYMRGRTLDNSFIILDEAQNTTREQMKMFLTRMGFGSKLVVTGDITQIDLPRGKKSGLIEAEKILKPVRDIGFCYLKEQDVVRHELVKKIITAYDSYYKQNPEEVGEGNEYIFRRRNRF